MYNSLPILRILFHIYLPHEYSQQDSKNANAILISFSLIFRGKSDKAAFSLEQLQSTPFIYM